MKRKFSGIHSFASYTAVLVVGLMGVVATNSAIAQSPSEKPQPLQMAQASSLEGSWRLANMIAGDSPMPMLPVGDLTADFAGCNRFSGGFETKGEQLKIGPLASTFKACEQSIMQQETRYLAALQGAQRYEVNADGLQIYYQTEEGSGVLRFTSQGVRALW